MKNANIFPRLCALSLTLLTLSAQAHTGHGTHSLLLGLLHPLGFDHLLAMVAVGLWSVSVLPARQVWQGPTLFVLSLALSAAFGAAMASAGITWVLVEHAVALSVVLFGAMLVLSWWGVPVVWGLGFIALAAASHGLAHGAETPATGFYGYAAGFLITSIVLHLLGVGLGRFLRSALAGRGTLVLTALGALTSGAGVLMFARL